MKCLECGNTHEFYETEIIARWDNGKRTLIETHFKHSEVTTIYCNSCGSDKIDDEETIH